MYMYHRCTAYDVIIIIIIISCAALQPRPHAPPISGLGVCLAVDMAELILDGGCREEQLAEGIVGILSPAVEQVDQQIGEVR